MSICQEAPALQKNLNPRSQIHIHQPQPDDAIAVHNLIRRSAFLDDNSLYCYLVLCTHFNSTSVIATLNNDQKANDKCRPDLAGVVTAYIPPDQPDTLFVWQVAVDPAAQNQGLASRMLNHILERPGLQHIRYVETTVTAGNSASRAMFISLARRYHTDIVESVMFDRRQHFLNLHDTEYKLKIGPLSGRGKHNQGAI